MRLPKSTYAERPWRIHEIAPDFELEDLWALPTPGGPHDLHLLVEQMADGDIQNPVLRFFFAVRWRLGELFGWDEAESGVGKRVASVGDRLPADLRPGPDLAGLPLKSVYQTENEYVAEMANETVHTLMHIGWVRDDAGGWRGEMAVLVKPNGAFGRAYMAFIKPFRYLFVYPALFHMMGRGWETTIKAT